MLRNHFHNVAYLTVIVLMASCAPKQVVDSRHVFDEGDTLVDTEKLNKPPKPRIKVAKRFKEGEEIVVEVIANDPDSDRLLYLFDWDGNGVYDQTSRRSKVKHAWSVDGRVTLKVRVQDEIGATGDAETTLTIRDQRPTARFEVDSSPREGEWVRLNGSRSLTPIDPIVRYEWDLNYRSKKGFRPYSQEGVEITYRWKKSRRYAVALRVTDSDGSQHITTQRIDVEDQKPTAKIVGPERLLIGEKGTFDGRYSTSVTDKIINYRWDSDYQGQFRDRLRRNSSRATFRWKLPGTYVVALQITDSDGSKGFATHQIVVEEPEPKPAPPPKKRNSSKKRSSKK